MNNLTPFSESVPSNVSVIAAFETWNIITTWKCTVGEVSRWNSIRHLDVTDLFVPAILIEH